jgi:hypothetical protein
MRRVDFPDPAASTDRFGQDEVGSLGHRVLSDRPTTVPPLPEALGEFDRVATQDDDVSNRETMSEMTDDYPDRTPSSLTTNPCAETPQVHLDES